MGKEERISNDPQTGFRDYAEHYLHTYRTRNGYGPKAAPGTMRRKETCIKQLEDYFGCTPMSSIKPRDILDCLSALKKHGKSMLRSDAAELKTLFRRASMPDVNGISFLPTNPAANIPLPPDPPSQQARKKPITSKQERQLYDWFLGHRPEWAILIPLACNVDLRPQDYLALKICDIDPDEQTIDIVRSQSFITGHGLITKTPKTPASAQKRYISKALMQMIAKHIRAHTNSRPDTWLVQGPHGGMLSESLFYKWFKNAAAAIGRPELSPYVMRATADDRISRGRFGNMKEMLAMQGRSDAATSIRHYQKLNPVSMRRHTEEIWAASHCGESGKADAQILNTVSSQFSYPDEIVINQLLTQMKSLETEVLRMESFLEQCHGIRIQPRSSASQLPRPWL